MSQLERQERIFYGIENLLDIYGTSALIVPDWLNFVHELASLKPQTPRLLEASDTFKPNASLRLNLEGDSKGLAPTQGEPKPRSASHKPDENVAFDFVPEPNKSCELWKANSLENSLYNGRRPLISSCSDNSHNKAMGSLVKELGVCDISQDNASISKVAPLPQEQPSLFDEAKPEVSPAVSINVHEILDQQQLSPLKKSEDKAICEVVAQIASPQKSDISTCAVESKDIHEKVSVPRTQKAELPPEITTVPKPKIKSPTNITYLKKPASIRSESCKSKVEAVESVVKPAKSQRRLPSATKQETRPRVQSVKIPLSPVRPQPLAIRPPAKVDLNYSTGLNVDSERTQVVPCGYSLSENQPESQLVDFNEILKSQEVEHSRKNLEKARRSESVVPPPSASPPTPTTWEVKTQPVPPNFNEIMLEEERKCSAEKRGAQPVTKRQKATLKAPPFGKTPKSDASDLKGTKNDSFWDLSVKKANKKQP